MADASDGALAPLLKDRPLQIAGRAWTLRFAMIASTALKERWKIEEDAPLLKRLARETITDIPALLWACLQTHHPDVPYAECVALADDANADELRLIKGACTDALRAGWGNPEKKIAAAAKSQS